MIDSERIPKSWTWSKMNVACEKIQDGTHFSPDQSKQLTAGPYPYVTAKNVRPSGIDKANLTFLAENDHRSIYERCDPRPGDVLLVKDGVNAGDAAINTFDGEISLLSSVSMLRTHRDVLEAGFLRYYLLSPQGYRSLTGELTGTAIKRIILRKIREMSVPIAPLNEQRRIVAKIEELFSDLDAGVAALERAKANLKRYRAAVLKAAVEGDLTAEWRAQHPDTEPASQLLTRILKQRREQWEPAQLAKFQAAGKEPPKNWREKYVEPVPPDTSGLPQLPKGWCWATWEQILAAAEGAFKRGPFGSALTKSIFVTQGYKVYEQYCPINDDCSYSRYYITEEKYHEMESFAVQAGDFLISCSGVTLGRITQIPPVFESGIINQALLRVRINDNVMRPQYFLRLFRSPFFQRYIFENSTGSAIPNVKGVKELKAIPIPLPPIDEQSHLVEEIDETISQINAAEEAIERDLLRAARLRQSILQQAFTGQLVPQDPTDEPASTLLERLRSHPPGANGDSELPPRRTWKPKSSKEASR